MMAATLIFLGTLIFIAHLFSYLFSRKRIPDVLLLIVVGLAIGPLLGWVHPSDLGQLANVFSSLTLIFILLDSGLGLSIDSLRRYWKGVFQVTLLSFLFSTAMATAISYFMGFEFSVSLMIGTMVAGTGASIVVPLLNQMKVSEYTRTVLTMESAISAVISFVLALSLMDAYKMGSMAVGSMVGRVLASLLIAALLGVVAGIVWSSLLDRVRKIENSMFLTPAFVFIVYGLTDFLEFSGAIAVLCFGVVLGNTDYFKFSFLDKTKKHEMKPLEMNEKGFVKEFVFILKSYYFVYIGISIPFGNGVALLYGLAITVALFVVRYLLLLVVGRENSVNDRRVVSLMIPKGLSAALLASIPDQINQAAGRIVIPDAVMIKHVVYAVIFFSIVTTSLMVFLTRKNLVKNEANVL
ncbi:MAG: cation:proton antiporter [Bacteroidales bacterium]|nr:cation:proton antiporter [Bacteroidales bacterium]